MKDYDRVDKWHKKFTRSFFVARDLNNYIAARLEDTGGRSCLKGRLIFTMNGDTHEEFPD